MLLFIYVFIGNITIMPRIIVYVCMQVENPNFLYYESQIIHTNLLLNLQTSSLTSFYFGIINQVPSMIYPLSIHSLHSILRLFPSLGRTSVYTSNMALNQAVPLDSRVVVFGPRDQNLYKQRFWTQPSLLTPCPYLTVLPRFSIIFPLTQRLLWKTRTQIER